MGFKLVAKGDPPGFPKNIKIKIKALDFVCNLRMSYGLIAIKLVGIS